MLSGGLMLGNFPAAAVNDVHAVILQLRPCPTRRRDHRQITAAAIAP
jgi:hypothetical protein